MNKHILIPTLLVTLLAPCRALGQPADSLDAGEFILNYDVPESPALVALGITPSNILRASSAKPAVASLLNQFASHGQVENGVALDFSPYFVFGGRLKNITEYRHNGWKRLAANTQVSFATVEDSSQQGDLRFGVGVRMTLFDAHDLLKDKTLGTDIDNALIAGAASLPTETEDEILPIGTYTTLKEIYSKARDRVRSKAGSSMAVGWSMSARLHSAIANADSVDGEQHTAWLSYRYSLGGGLDLLALAQAYACQDCHPRYRSGVALRANGRSWDFAGELFFDSIRGDALSGRVGLGVNGELRLPVGLGLIASLATEPVEGNGSVDSRIRMRTSVRWNSGQ
jgi:hypothetical protein